MDLIRSTKPFIKLWQIFGLFPYSLQESNGFYFLTESRTLLRYSKLLFGTLMFADGGTVIWSKVPFLIENEISTRLVLVLSTVTVYVSFVMIFWTMASKEKILRLWLNQFNSLSISSTLRIPSAELEWFNRGVLFCTSLYFAAVLLTNCLTYVDVSSGTVLMEFVFFSRLWVTHLFLKHFVIFVNYVRFFYATVRRNLEGRTTGSGLPGYWVAVLRKLRSRDLFVKSFVEVLHSIYLPVLLVQLIWFFVSFLCDVTVWGRAGMPTVTQVHWMAYIGLETFLYISVCHFTEKEAQKTIDHLPDLFIDLDNPELLHEFDLFSLQLQHAPLKFNALGFFNLDYTLLYSMIGAVTTYTVILLQFQSSDWAAKHHSEFAFNASSSSPLDDMFRQATPATNVTRQ